MTEAEVEALRRRLYRPAASPDDVRRYEAAAPSRIDGPALPAPRQVSSRPSRARSTLRAALIPGGVLVVALLALAALATTAAPRPVARAVPAAAVFGRGSVHRVAAAAAVRGAQEFAGHGSATIAVDRDDLSFGGGRLLVVMTVDRSGPTRWAATRIDARRDWSTFTRVLAQSARAQRAGSPSRIAFSYTGAPPALIRVEAPATTGWDLAVTPRPADDRGL